MTQRELMAKIVEKLNEGGLYNALELANAFNESIGKTAASCGTLVILEKIERIPLNKVYYYCKKHLTI